MYKNYNSLSAGRDACLKKCIGKSDGVPPFGGSTSFISSQKWLVSFLLIVFVSFFSNAQTTVINGTIDGSFEGANFAADGWNPQQGAVSGNNFATGNAATIGFTPHGSKGVFVTANGTSRGYAHSASFAWIYKDVTLNAGETIASLTMDMFGNPGDSGFDGIVVGITDQSFIASTTIGATGLMTATAIPGMTIATTATNGFIEDGNYAVSTGTTRTFTFSGAALGNATGSSTRRIWIGWRCDGSFGNTSTPMSFDRVNMTTALPSTFDATSVGGLWSSPATWVAGFVPAAGNSISIPAGAIVTVDQIASYGDLTINGTVQWNGTAHTMNISGNITINSGGRFLAHTTTGGSPTVNVGGNFTNDGYANLLSTLLTFNGAGSTLGGSGVFQGAGTEGIIRGLTFSNTGSNAITTSQNLVVNGGIAHLAGSLNTGGKLRIDNTVQSYGSPFNLRVESLAVTNMGTLYNAAPVVFGGTVIQYADAVVAALNSRYVSGNNVYLCTAGGTFNATPPTSTATSTFTTSGPTLLYIGTVGTLGNPFQVTAVTLGTQYFYGGNLYTCTVAGGLPSAANPPVHTSGTASSGAASFRYVGTPATATVNYDATTQTVRTLILTSQGSGYSSAPAIVFSVGVVGGTGSGAAASAVYWQSLTGLATGVTFQKSGGAATITGGLTINSDQGTSVATVNPQASTGVGNIFTTNGGNNYTVAPVVGFALPPALNLVTAAGTGFTSAPTITVTGGNLVSGSALTTSNFTITVNQGMVESVYLNTGTSATYSTLPTLTITGGGGGSGATLAFPAGCLPTATANIGSNGQLTSFTMTNAGFGYAAAPTVGVGTTSGTANGGTFTTVATAPTARIALYNLTLNFFAPAASAIANGDDAAIPANRKMNILSLAGNGANGLNLSSGLTLFGTAPLSLTGSLNTPGNILDLGGNNLNFTWPTFAGVSGTASATTNAFVKNGSISLTGRGGSGTFTFPFGGNFVFTTGTTPVTATTGSNATNITVTETAAPGNSVSGGTGIAAGTRAFRVVTKTFNNVDATTGLNPTASMIFTPTDALTLTQDQLFVAEAPALDGAWTIRSTAYGASGAVPTYGAAKATATVAPGPIVPNGTRFYAWSGSNPTITDFTPTLVCANSGAFTITGTNLIGVTAVAIGGTPVSAFTVVNNTTITGFAGSGTDGFATVVKNATTATGLQSITVSASPSAPVVAPSDASIITGGAVSFTATGGAGTFNWYDAATGGNLLFTGATYETNVCTSRSFYVSEDNGSCQGGRTAVPVTVQDILPSAAPASFCGTGGTVTLSVTPADPSITYTWTSLTASAILNSATGASVTATLTETSDFKVTATTTAGGCSVEKFVSIGVYPLPSATVTTSANGVCPGTSAQINSGLTAGNFTSLPITHAPRTAPASATTLVAANVFNVPLTSGTGDDGGWANIPMNFDFNFFGTSYNKINIGTNGTLTFGTYSASALGDFDFISLPSVTEPFNMVAVLAIDNDLRSADGGAIKYWTEGIAPNRKFVVSYEAVKEYGDTKYSTAQAIFYETTGIIEPHVTSSTNVDRVKLVGVNNGDGTIGALAYKSGTTASAVSPINPISSPLAYRFSPPANYFTTWTATDANGTTTLVDNQTNTFSLDVQPDITTTYTISYTNKTTLCTNALNSAQVVMTVLGTTPPTGVNAVATPATACFGGTVTLSTDNAIVSSGFGYQWQISTDGGANWANVDGAITATLTSAPINALTSYRCGISSCGGALGYTSQVDITFTNNILTTAGDTQCGTKQHSLTATATEGTTINWYDVATGGTSLFTGANFTPTISAPTTYYVAAETVGCSSPRVAVLADVEAAPALTLSASALTACESTNSATVTLTSDVADFDTYTWSPSTGVSGDETTGWTFNTAVSRTYTLTASQAGGLQCANVATVNVTVNPISLSTTASLATVCAGAPVTLTGTIPSGVTIGAQTTTEFGGGVYRFGFGTGDFRHQLVYTAAELSAAGVPAGNINSISFNVTSAGSGAADNYTISMANTAATALSTTFETTALTQVYTAATYTAVAGANLHTFDTPFVWDGVSNVLVNICYNVATFGGTSTVAATTPAALLNSNLLGLVGACSATTGSTFANRPLATFGIPPAPHTYSWSDGTNEVGTTASLVVNPTATTTYTLTATRTADGCTKTSAQVINAIALPATPTNNDSVQCGVGTPTCSVTGVSGTSVFEWFLVPTGGTALAGQTGASLTAYPISESTIFYVSEKSGICSSERVAVNAVVSTAGVATPTTTVSAATINIGGSVTLTATGTGGTINWYSQASGGSIVFTGASFTPAAVSCTPGTFNYYAEEEAAGCPSLRALASYTVRPLISSDPANTLICSAGGSVELNANVTGGSNFVWTPALGLSSTNTALTTASPTTTTVYSFTCTVVGCGTQSGTITVGVIEGATFTPTALPATVCVGNTTELNSNLNGANFSAACVTPVTALSTAPVGAVTLASNNALTDLASLPQGVSRINTSTDDNYWGNVPIGFTFNYFGADVTNVFISTNGTISLGTGGSTAYSFPGGFPSTNNPASTIAVCARDLRFDTGNGALKYWTQGIAPTRQFIVQYDSVDIFSGGGKQSAEAVFYETTGVVDIRVVQATNGTGTTGSSSVIRYIGLQNATRLIGATSPNCSTNVQNYWNGVEDEISSPQTWRFTPPVNYSFQWFTDGNPIDGATSSTYTTEVLGTPGTVTYTVEATNPNTVCTASRSIDVTVNAAPTAPISSGDVTECANLVPVTLTATAPSGSVVDWYDAATDGTLLASGTNTYNVSVAGTYYAQSRTTSGSCVSKTRTAVVYTQDSVPTAPAATSPIALCQNGATSALTATATGTNTLAWYTVATGGDASAIAPTPSTASVGSTSYWVAQVSAEGCNSSRTQIIVNVTAAPSAPSTTANGPYCQNAVATQLSATADGSNTLNWYADASGGTASATAPTPVTTAAGTFIFYVSQTNANGCESARASISVVVNPALSASVSVSATTTSVCSGNPITFTANIPPSITALSYAWFLNDNAVGSNSSTYILDEPAANDVVYVTMTANAASCLVGSPASSTPITLTGVDVTPTVSIKVNETAAVCAGTSLEFSVLSSSSMGSEPTFQWNLGGSPIEGATSATYTTSSLANGASITLTMTSSLTSCITNASVTSNAIVTAINAATSVTNPVSANVCAGSSATFSVTASGTGPFTYQWKKDNIDISGANASSYTIPSAAAGDVASYTVVVNGTCGNATSLGANLTLKTATSISAQPVAVSQCAGTTANFSVTAAGAGTLSYQWRRNGAPIVGETNATLAVSNITTANAGNYSVVVTGECGFVTSSNALLTVQPALVINSQPSGSTVCAGSTANFSVTATGLALTYQWKKDGNEIGGATSATLSIPNVQSANAGAYTVVVGSACGTETSSAGTLTVNPTTAITTQPTSVIVCAGGNATFTVATVGVGTISYQWTKDGVNIPGATTNTLALTNVTDAGDAGAYRVKVSGGTCSAGVITSTAASLSVPENTVFLTSGAGTINQTLCSTSAIANITYGTTTATGATVTGLPAGVNGVWNNNVVTISGTPTELGVFNYTVTTTGGCATAATETGTITINLLNEIVLTSGVGSNAQTLCNTADFASITYATTAATGATFSGLPAGVTGNWASDAVTISGTPTVSGSFNYTVTLTGGCGNVTATGNITANFTVWNGTGWSNAAPTASVGAIIAGNYSVAADLAACSLIVNNNAIVTVPSGFDFTIVGKVDVQEGSSLTFDNNANLLQSGTTNANTGEITSKRTNTTMRRLDYTYWSSPTAKADYALKTFSPMTLSLIPSEPGGVTGTSRFYYLDEVANAFVNVEPTTTYFDDANIARGWSIRAPNTFPANGTTATFLANFIGKPNNGDYSRTVTTSNRGYNLIGNPYPSPISASDFLAANPGALYFWTHKVQNGAPGTNYATLTNLGFAQPAPTDNLVFEGIIQTGQGFLYKPTTAGTAVFNNSMRRSDNRGQFFRDGNEGIERHRIWLNLSDSNNAGLNQILVGYMTGATQDVDSSIDGVLNYTGTGIATTINDQNFAIQGRSLPFEATDEVPMNFKAETDGSYTIAIDHVDGLFSGDQNIYLKDNLTGITHNIKESAYTFASVAGTFASRFAVVYQSAPLGIETPSLDANSVIVYKKDTSLHINSGSAVMASVKIYDIRGRLIIEQNNINASTTVFNNLNAEQQVLLVQITSDDNKVVTKKVVY